MTHLFGGGGVHFKEVHSSGGKYCFTPLTPIMSVIQSPRAALQSLQWPNICFFSLHLSRHWISLEQIQLFLCPLSVGTLTYIQPLSICLSSKPSPSCNGVLVFCLGSWIRKECPLENNSKISCNNTKCPSAKCKQAPVPSSVSPSPRCALNVLLPPFSFLFSCAFLLPYIPLSSLFSFFSLFLPCCLPSSFPPESQSLADSVTCLQTENGQGGFWTPNWETQRPFFFQFWEKQMW